MIIAVHSASPPIALIARLRAITMLPIAEVRSRMISGIPLLDCELFMNDHESISPMIREILALADGNTKGVERVSVWEEADGLREPISVEVAANILDRHDETIRRFEGD